MTVKKRRGKKQRDALAPACYKDAFFFTMEDAICKTCPFFFPCGAHAHGSEFVKMLWTNRKDMEVLMVQKRVPYGDAIFAITKIFGVTNNAANLSYSRWKKQKKEK